MGDFIFSKINKDNGFLSKKLRCIYGENKIKTYEYHSHFGSIAYCENHYNGFSPYNTEDFLLIVIGGPILNFRDNNFISANGGNEGTIAINRRWKEQKKIVWDEDLSGPFVIFNFDKRNGHIELISDMMSFIPVYSNLQNDILVIGTHIDTIARINNNSLDKVSIADFILHEVVTYPYTIYNGIKQLAPATIHNWNLETQKNKFSQTCYWLPREVKNIDNIDNIAKELNKSLNKYVNRVIHSKAKVATFISGGEDSRVVLSAIPKEYPKDSFIFVDKPNYEALIAKKVTKKLNAKIFIEEREPDHYWHILKAACDLIGTCGDYAHVHSYGFHKHCSFDNYDVIFGGFLADTLLKGHHVAKKKIPKFLHFFPIPEIAKVSQFDYISSNNFFLDPMVISKIKERRISHYQRIKELRPESVKEWFNIWPISMHNDIPNIYGNRRLFRSYEPFTDSAIVKISSVSPQSYKLNRRLFQKAFKNLYRKTKFIPHASGYYPYLPWYFNKPILAMNKTYKKIEEIFKKDLKNEGSWSNWDELIKSNMAYKISNKYEKEIEIQCGDIFKNDFNFNILDNKDLNTRQKRIIIQLGYQFSKIDVNYNENS